MNNQDIKRLKIGTFFLVLIVFIVLINAYWPETYGNDIPSMEKVISKQEAIRTKVSVYKVEEIYNYKIAGFIDEHNEVGVAFFQADEKGNYVFQGMNEKSTRFGIQLTYMKFANVNTESVGVDIIASFNSAVSQIQRVIRDSDISTVKVTGNPSLTVIEIPDTYRDSYNTKFIFYDKVGKVFHEDTYQSN